MIGIGLGLRMGGRAVPRRNMLRNTGNAGAVLGLLPSPGSLPTRWSSGSELTRTVTDIGTVSGLPYFQTQFTGSFTGNYFINLSGLMDVPAANGQQWVASIYAQAIGTVTGASALTLVPSARLANGNFKIGKPSVSVGFPASLTRFATPAATFLDADNAAGPVAFFLAYLQLVCTGTVNVTLRFAGAQVERGAAATPWQA